MAQLEIMPPSDTVDDLQERLRRKEIAGFQLVTLGSGSVDGQPAILATYLRRSFGDAPPPLILKDIGTGTLAQLEAAVTQGEAEGTLISYAGALIAEQETTVAVYRQKT